jgi:lipopolysaccharide/colanic/teichoic acid biosynthesis glycosyltransferase
MSLIGPRPTPFGLVRVFEENVHRYGDRHRVKAGITGWAQVHGIGRGGERYSESLLTERTEWDNYYIENWSLWLDVKILFMTVMAVLRSFRNGD